MNIKYASIDEAWGASSVISRPLPNPFKDVGVQQDVLGQTPAEPDDPSVRRKLSRAYQMEGLRGVLPYIDPVILRDLRTPIRHPEPRPWMDLEKEDLLYIVLALFAVLFAIDC